jgi:hypothetical protein
LTRKGKKYSRTHNGLWKKQKQQITATLCCTTAGKLLPSFFIFKGKILRPLKNVKVPEGVVCTTQEKA